MYMCGWLMFILWMSNCVGDVILVPARGAESSLVSLNQAEPYLKLIIIIIMISCACVDHSFVDYNLHYIIL